MLRSFVPSGTVLFRLGRLQLCVLPHPLQQMPHETRRRLIALAGRLSQKACVFARQPKVKLDHPVMGSGRWHPILFERSASVSHLCPPLNVPWQQPLWRSGIRNFQSRLAVRPEFDPITGNSRKFRNNCSTHRSHPLGSPLEKWAPQQNLTARRRDSRTGAETPSRALGGGCGAGPSTALRILPGAGPAG